MNSNNHYCWLCLKRDGWAAPLPIFEGEYSLATKLRNLLGIELKQDESLPQVICHLCLAKVAFLDEFNVQVKSSTTLLNSFTATKNCQVLNTTAVTDETRPASSRTCAPVNSLTPIGQKENAAVDTPTDSPAIKQALSTNPPVDEQPLSTNPPADEQALSTNPPADEQALSTNPPADEQALSDVSYTLHSGRVSTVVSKRVHKKLKCSRCKFATVSERVYKHHVDNVVKCLVCSAVFCTLKGLKIHSRLRHERRKRRRSRSSDSFDNDNSYNNDDTDSVVSHSKSNDDNYVSRNKSIVDEIDDKLSGQNIYRKKDVQISNVNHSEQNHTVKENRVMKLCELCDKVFMSEKDFTEHNDEYHSSSKIENQKRAKLEYHSPSKVAVEKKIQDKERVGNNQLNTSGTMPDKPRTTSIMSSSASSKSTESIPRSKEDNTSEQTVKRKSAPSVTPETFACWKCKREYESRAVLFVHNCVPPEEDGNCTKPNNDSSDNDSDSDGSIKARSKKGNNTYKLSSDSDSVNSKDKKQEDQGIDVVYNRNSGHDHATVELSDSDDHDSCQVDPLGMISAVYSIPDSEVVLSETDKSPNQTASDCGNTLPSGPLKKCNECGDTFTSMKDLVLHKRIHKT